MNRQRDFYYIAQELVNSFDRELDVLYQMKQRGKQIDAKNFQAFDKIKFQLAVAWEFSEKNMHEMEDLYSLVLENANSKSSKHQLASKFILRKMPDWMSEGWVHGDRSAVISLAQHFSDANDLFKTANPQGQTANFDRYARASLSTRQKAQQESLIRSKMRSKTLLDQFIASEWVSYQKSREDENIKPEERTPQSVQDIKPGSDENGIISGRSFPMGAWALTFDDGPHPQYTQKMYGVLRVNDVHGTFFWLSKNILAYPGITEEAAKYGFNRASHSFTHPQLPKLSDAGLAHEITEAGDSFAKVIGTRPTLFRCPYGACGPSGSKVRQLIAKNNMLSIIWNVDTLEWQDKNPASIFARTKKQVDVQGRGIVLFHDIHPQSVEAVKLLITYMKSSKNISIQPLVKILSDLRGKAYVSP